MATIRQALIRDFTQLLKTRGLRLAALGPTIGTGPGASQSSDWYKVYTHVNGTLAAPAGTVYRIVIDLDATKVTALDASAVGGDVSMVVPIPDRV